MPGFSRQNGIEIRTRTTHPTTPPSGYVYIFRMSDDGSILYKDSFGNVRELTNLGLESLVASLSGKVDIISGSYLDAAYVASISGYLQSEIDGIQTQINNLDLTYATDAAVAATSAYLQSEIDALNFSGVTEAELASISAYLQSEIVGQQSQVVSISSQIANLDNTYATDAAVAATSAYLLSQITNLGTTYSTDAELAAMSASIIVYTPSVIGSLNLNTTESVYRIVNSHILPSSLAMVTLIPPNIGDSLYPLAVTNVVTGSLVVELSDIPAVAGYQINYLIYSASFGVEPPYVPPTYATWDTSFVTGRTYSNGNLTVAHANNGSPARTNIGRTSGKWVFSVTPIDGGAADDVIGLVLSSWPMDSYPGVAAYPAGLGFYAGNTIFEGDNGNVAPGVTYTTNDEISLYVDLDGGNYRFYKNGTAVYGSDRSIPDWSSGQTWYAAAGAGGPGVTNTLNAGATGGSANMISIATARGANVGWYSQ